MGLRGDEGTVAMEGNLVRRPCLSIK